LKTLNCDELQGFLISRPLPAEQAAHLLAFTAVPFDLQAS
jgi:EAL domain-containing protein (putative c-di-GMP-specific phosphodiesterase class I)